MRLAVTCFSIVLASCKANTQKNIVVNNIDTGKTANKDTVLSLNTDSIKKAASIAEISQNKNEIKKDTVVVKGDAVPQQLLDYARSLIGTPYKYASINPKEGFDCSGFITHVFNHFNITVPRSSVDFTNYGKTITTAEARTADLILFTGTDSSRTVGHMGIIISNDTAAIKFIHATSGKANGVTITPLNEYYKHRFVKLIRVFN
jgi:cell wall-associated NlpC family hydrolase